MKATGIVRKIDELGRVVVPMELRKNLDLKEGDSLEIYVDGELIIFKKYKRGCISCGKMSNLKKLPNGTTVCPKCLEEAKWQ